MINKQFLLAGNAIFTVENPQGEYYTFRIKRKNANARFGISWFINLLTGPDNTSDYTYIGLLNPTTGDVREKTDTRPVRVAKWAIKHIYNNKPLPDGYKIHHEGKCCRCGRTLTTPESCETGIGPECAKLLGI